MVEFLKGLRIFDGHLLTLLLSTFFNRNACHKYRHRNHISQSGIFKVKGLSTFLNCHLIQFYSFTSALGFTLTLILYGTHLVLKMCQPNLHIEPHPFSLCLEKSLCALSDIKGWENEVRKQGSF